MTLAHVCLKRLHNENFKTIDKINPTRLLVKRENVACDPEVDFNCIKVKFSECTLKKLIQPIFETAIYKTLGCCLEITGEIQKWRFLIDGTPISSS